MRKVVLLLLALMLCAWFIPATPPAEAQLIPWDEWANFWWNVQTEAVGDTIATVDPIIGQHQFRFRFWNGGVVNSESKIPLRYYLRIVDIDGEGWNAYVNPTYLPLGQDKVGNATVTVNAGPQPSYIANITCQVEMHVKLTAFIKYGNITFQVRSKPYRYMGVTIENNVFEGKQEKIYRVPINITNNGNYEDTYSVSVSYAPSNWLYSVSESQIYLFPGESATVNFTFHIPHERFYIQYESYVMLVKVQSTSQAGYSITKPVVVSLSGYHMTMGQTAVAAATLPSIFLLIIIGSALAYTRNPCNQLPKPWRDPQEKKALANMDWRTVRHKKKLMREEYKSAYYFCQAERVRKRHIRSLIAERKQKQSILHIKIISAWREAWMGPHKEWKEQRRKIQEEHNQVKRHLLTKWRKMNHTIVQANTELGTNIAPVAKPIIPFIPEIPEPRELPKPRVPQYKVDSNYMRLIEPDGRLIAKVMALLQRALNTSKVELERIQRMGITRQKKLRLAAQSLEKKMDASMQRAQQQIDLEHKKRQQHKKLLEHRYKLESETRIRDREHKQQRESLRKRFKQQQHKKKSS